MFKRPHYIVVSGVVLLGVVLVGLPRHTAATIKFTLGSLFLPLFGMASAGSKAVEKVGDVVMPRRVLEAQLDALKKENASLKFELMQQGRIVQENEQLRAALAWQRRQPWTLKLAKVSARDPANWWRTVQIDAGEKDGVRRNNAVLTAQGLIGRVDEVGTSVSVVVLLGDPNCRVSAKVWASKDRGVVTSATSSVLDPSLVALTFLPRHSTNKPGALVVTSGEGGIFPEGLVIGKIAEVESVGQGLYMEARVKLAVDVQRLDYVWVMLGDAR